MGIEIKKVIEIYTENVEQMKRFQEEYKEDLLRFEFVLQALKEKEEKEKGCEYCNRHIPINDFAKDYSIEVDNAEISLWEDLKCLSHIKIKYCPMCGRKLVEE